MKNFQKNSVSRYYGSFFKMAFTCMAVFAIIMIIVTTKLYKNESFNELERNTNLLTGGLNNEYNLYHSIDTESAWNQYRDFMSIFDFTVYVYDSDGKPVLTPDKSAEPLSDEIMQKISQSAFLDFDATTISEKEQSMMFARTFTVHCDEHNMSDEFYITAFSSANILDEFQIKIYIAAIIAFAACFVPRYIIIRKQRLLTDDIIGKIHRVTEQYSKGDFSERLDTDLPKDFSEICMNINQLAESVETAENTSQTFVSNVSHELRTPLTTIGGFVDGIIDGTIPKREQSDYLGIISSEVKRLSTVIKSMLNMTKFENGTLVPNFKKVNINDLVFQRLLMFQQRIEQKHIEVEGFAESYRVDAVVDDDLIGQVVTNLIENAIKFINEEGTLTIKIESEKDLCHITIRNTGEGLKDDEISKIFKRFYKTDSSRSKDTTGLGLGLSIAKKLVDFHNGSIVVKSVYGEYTEFDVILPLEQNN